MDTATSPSLPLFPELVGEVYIALQIAGTDSGPRAEQHSLEIGGADFGRHHLHTQGKNVVSQSQEGGSGVSQSQERREWCQPVTGSE